VGRISRFDASRYETQIAAEVKGFNPEDWMAKKEAKRFEPFISYAVAATRMALEDSGLRISDENASRVGVITGCGLGGLRFMEDTIFHLKQNGPKRVSPFFIPLMIGNMAPGMISILFGAKGPNLSIATACAAGTHAVGDSFKLILEGRVDAMITGGTEAVISPSCIAGFNAMKALSTRNAEPERASRPFGRDPDPGGARARPAARGRHLRRDGRLRAHRRRVSHDLATAGRKRRGALHADGSR
jgi:3-oxoacyl-[acyl-carrier-protein] synthase II